VTVCESPASARQLRQTLTPTSSVADPCFGGLRAPFSTLLEDVGELIAQETPTGFAGGASFAAEAVVVARRWRWRRGAAPATEIDAAQHRGRTNTRNCMLSVRRVAAPAGCCRTRRGERPALLCLPGAVETPRTASSWSSAARPVLSARIFFSVPPSSSSDGRRATLAFSKTSARSRTGSAPPLVVPRLHRHAPSYRARARHFRHATRDPLGDRSRSTVVPYLWPSRRRRAEQGAAGVNQVGPRRK